MSDLSAQVDHIEDDVLRLMFLACHPALTPESRAALTLRLVGGLTTAEIARGFLATEAAMGQRISRAKKLLTEVRAEFELPVGDERVARLDDVMAVVYLIFNEGYTATAGSDWMRTDLTTEAIRLARMLAELVPDEPEVHGLQALLELQASRIGRPRRRRRPARPARRPGPPALGRAAHPSRPGRAGPRRGLAARGKPVGRYYLQAAIASVHARAASAAETDWRAIARLYDVLAQAAPGPVVEVNRAVAHGRAFGPAAGLAVLDALPRRRARRLAPAAQRAGRPARPRRPPRRGGRDVPGSGGADPQRERTDEYCSAAPPSPSGRRSRILAA